jgi:hypothetical protein
MSITEPGIYVMSNKDYHADPIEGGSLSSTGAKKLSTKTPAHFKWDMDHPVHKDTFDFGTAAHSLILEGDNSGIVIVNADSWRTKAAQEQRDAAHAHGKTPMLIKDYEQVEAMAEQIKNHPDAMTLLSDGKPELSGFWQHETGIWLRVRFDWLPNHRGPGLILSDYKTAVSADPIKFAKACADLGYHQQAAWYIDAAVAFGLSPDPAFAFIVQEKTAPYLVNVIELDTKAIDLGRAQNEKAIRLYQDCKTANRWPGYPLSEPIPLPRYAEYQIEEQLEGAA